MRRLFTRERWYERIGDHPAVNKPALVLLSVARYEGLITVDYLVSAADHVLVRIGSKNRRHLEEFAEDLATVDVAAVWFPVRAGDPAVEALRQPERIARSLGSLAEAFTAPPPPPEAAGPSLAVIAERLGQAAAGVTPATDASRRTQSALASLYERLTGEAAPF